MAIVPMLLVVTVVMSSFFAFADGGDGSASGSGTTTESDSGDSGGADPGSADPGGDGSDSGDSTVKGTSSTSKAESNSWGSYGLASVYGDDADIHREAARAAQRASKTNLGASLGTSGMFSVGYSTVPIGYSISVTYEPDDDAVETGPSGWTPTLPDSSELPDSGDFGEEDFATDDVDAGDMRDGMDDDRGGDDDDSDLIIGDDGLVHVQDGDLVPGGTELTIKVERDVDAFLKYLEEELGSSVLDSMLDTGDLEVLEDALPEEDPLLEAVEEQLAAGVKQLFPVMPEFLFDDDDDDFTPLVVERVTLPGEEKAPLTPEEQLEQLLDMLLPREFIMYVNGVELPGDPANFSAVYTVVSDTEITMGPAYSLIAPMSYVNGLLVIDTDADNARPSTAFSGSGWVHDQSGSITSTSTFTYTWTCSHCGQNTWTSSAGSVDNGVLANPRYTAPTTTPTGSRPTTHRVYDCDKNRYLGLYSQPVYSPKTIEIRVNPASYPLSTAADWWNDLVRDHTYQVTINATAGGTVVVPAGTTTTNGKIIFGTLPNSFSMGSATFGCDVEFNGQTVGATGTIQFGNGSNTCTQTGSITFSAAKDIYIENGGTMSGGTVSTTGGSITLGNNTPRATTATISTGATVKTTSGDLILNGGTVNGLLETNTGDIVGGGINGGTSTTILGGGVIHVAAGSGAFIIDHDGYIAPVLNAPTRTITIRRTGIGTRSTHIRGKRVDVTAASGDVNVGVVSGSNSGSTTGVVVIDSSASGNVEIENAYGAGSLTINAPTGGTIKVDHSFAGGNLYTHNPSEGGYTDNITVNATAIINGGGSFTTAHAGGNNGATVTATSSEVRLVNATVPTVYMGGRGTGSNVTATAFITHTAGSSITTLYGGGHGGAATVTRANMTMSGGTVYDIYGGYEDAAGTVTTANISVGGAASSTVDNNVYGGGQAGHVGDANIYIGGQSVIGGTATTATTSAGSGTVTNNVYGGGAAGGCTVTNAKIYLGGQDGTATGTVSNNLYGGGADGSVDDVLIRLGGTGATSHGTVTNNLFGGGLDGTITNDVQIYIGQTGTGTITNGNLYGGGDGGNVGNDVFIELGSATDATGIGRVSAGNLYGGGNSGTVGGNIDIKVGQLAAGSVATDLYGGGNNSSADVTGNVTIQVGETATGLIGQDFYGGGNSGKVGGNVVVGLGGNAATTGTGTVNQNFFGGGNSGEVTGNVTVQVGDTAPGNVGVDFHGGGNTGKVGGNVTIGVGGTASGSVGHGTIGNNFYGGGIDGDVDGYVLITFGSAANATITTGSLHGGSKNIGKVLGNVTIDVGPGTGIGAIGQHLYGGSAGGGTTAINGSSVPQQILINLSRCAIGGDAYGGALGAGNVGHVTLNWLGATAPTGYIAGQHGIHGGSVSGSSNAASVVVNIDANIARGPAAQFRDTGNRSHIYGGGEAGKVQIDSGFGSGTVVVNINATVGVSGSTPAADRINVYGGSHTSGPVDITTVNVGSKTYAGADTAGTVYGDVWGGGAATGNVTTSNVHLGHEATPATGTVIGTVYGGSAGSATVGTANIVIGEVAAGTVGGAATPVTNDSPYGEVYGGGSDSGKVDTANITIGFGAAGTVNGPVHGGSAASGAVDDTRIWLGYGAVGTVNDDNVYGGGSGSGAVGNANISIGNTANGIVHNGHVFGGGTSTSTATATVNNAVISLGGDLAGVSGSLTNGNVYGGGEGPGDVGDAKLFIGGYYQTRTGLTLTGGAGTATISNTVANSDIHGHVYGGGTATSNVTTSTIYFGSLGSRPASVPASVPTGTGHAVIAGNVYGGADRAATNATYNVTTATLYYLNGTINGAKGFLGGGEAGSVGTANVNIVGPITDTPLTATNRFTQPTAHIFGGGSGYSTTQDSLVEAANVTVAANAAVADRHVYGGSYPKVAAGNSTSNEVGSTKVEIHSPVGNNNNRMNVYGGGAGVGDVTGNRGATVTESGANTTTYGTQVFIYADVIGNVYGGGEDSSVAEDAYVRLVTGNVVGSVYGGGTWYGWYEPRTEFPAAVAPHRIESANAEQNSTVGLNTRVDIQGGTVGVNVYGGGHGTNNTNTTPNYVYTANHVNASGGTNLQTWVTVTGTVFGDVYGGGWNSNANRTFVDINSGGTVQTNVYGGGRAESSSESWDPLDPSGLPYGADSLPAIGGTYGYDALITRDTKVTINGGTVGVTTAANPDFSHLLGSVYGGGYGSVPGTAPNANLPAHIGEGTEVIVTDNGRVLYDVYGGGLSNRTRVSPWPVSTVAGENTATVALDTKVTVQLGGTVGNDVHGGGRYNDVNTTTPNKTNVFIKDSGIVHHNVYGGGYNGRAYQTEITIDGTYDHNNLTGAFNVDNDVYGGGTGDIDANILTDTTINLQNGSVGGNMHGGGEGHLVTDETKVLISGGRVLKNVYGGGRGDGTDTSSNKGDVGTVAGNTSTVSTVVVGANNGTGVVHKHVYGGGVEDGVVYGSTKVDILASGYVMGDVYGGGFTRDGEVYHENHAYGGVAASPSVFDQNTGTIGSKVHGFTEVTVNGDNWGTDPDYNGLPTKPPHANDKDNGVPMVNGSVYGGGRGIGGPAIPMVDDSTIMGADSQNRSTIVIIKKGRVSINTATVSPALTRANVYGGGINSSIAADTDVLVEKDAIVGITRTTSDVGSVFGGSIHEAPALLTASGGGTPGGHNTDPSVLVYGNTNVMIHGYIYQSVWGGGHWADVEGNSTVTIHSTGATPEGTDHATIALDLIGGGLNANINGADGTKVLVDSDTRVCRDVFGGGWNTTNTPGVIGMVWNKLSPGTDIKTDVKIKGNVGMDVDIKYIEPTPPGGDPMMGDGGPHIEPFTFSNHDPRYGNGSDPQKVVDRGGNVFGGGYGFGDVEGDSVVLLDNGSIVMRDVFGGGFLGEINGLVGTWVELQPAGQVYGTIHGGGFGRTADILNDTQVFIFGKVGRDEHDPRSNNGSLNPVMEGSTPTWPYGYKIPGNVYGGGSYGDVHGDKGTYVEVRPIGGSGVIARVSNNVYGGGFEGQVTSTQATADVLVTQGAQVWHSVFGGGHQRPNSATPSATRNAIVQNKTNVVVNDLNPDKGHNTFVGHPWIANRSYPGNDTNYRYVEEWGHRVYNSYSNPTAFPEHEDLELHAGRIFGGGEYALVSTETNVLVDQLDQIVFRTISGGSFGINTVPSTMPRNVTLNNLGESKPMATSGRKNDRYNNGGVYDDLNYYAVVKHFQDYTQSNIDDSQLTVYYNLLGAEGDHDQNNAAVDPNEIKELGLKYSPEIYHSVFTTTGGTYHPWRPHPHMDIIVEPQMEVPNGDTFFRIETGYTIDMQKGGFVAWQVLQPELLIDHDKGIASMNRIYGPYHYNIAHTLLPNGMPISRFAYNYLPRTLFGQDIEHKSQVDIIGVRFYIPPTTLDFVNGETTDVDGWSGGDPNTGNSGVGGIPGLYAGSSVFTPSMAVDGELIQKTRRAVQGAGSGQTTYFSEQRYDQITGRILRMIDAAAHDEGGPAILMADTMNGKVIQGRMYLDPSKKWPEDKVIDLRVYTTPDRIAKTKKTMERYFKNTFAYVQLAQTASFGTEVEIAADVDLSKLDKDSLIFYTYNEETNTYKRIDNPRYFIDSVGYLHFFTSRGGAIVITDSPLARK